MADSSDDTIRVRISYSPNKYEIGTVKDLPAEEAQMLIREGRATAHYGDVEYGGPWAVTTVVPAEQSSPARQAKSSQTPASTSQPAASTGVKRTTTSTPE